MEVDKVHSVVYANIKAQDTRPIESDIYSGPVIVSEAIL